ncbi:unnamed protein product, partial [Chrysoparadoxa australica]
QRRGVGEVGSNMTLDKSASMPLDVERAREDCKLYFSHLEQLSQNRPKLLQRASPPPNFAWRGMDAGGEVQGSKELASAEPSLPELDEAPKSVPEAPVVSSRESEEREAPPAAAAKATEAPVPRNFAWPTKVLDRRNYMRVHAPPVRDAGEPGWRRNWAERFKQDGVLTDYQINFCWPPDSGIDGDDGESQSPDTQLV